ncbi:MAG: protein translocase subunit SecDF [Saprospiraceae bacterium]
MQGKGIVKFFLIVLSLFCLLQYFYMFPTRSVEANAEAAGSAASARALAAGKSDEVQRNAEKEARSSYLDSMSSEVIFSIPLLKKYTYEDMKNAQLALGLDLKGGMSVVLQVDLREFIRTLARDSKDPALIEKALEKAALEQQSTQSDFVTLFARAYKDVGGGNLAEAFNRSEVLGDEIKFDTPDSEVVTILRAKADETVDLTYKQLKERIDELGVVQPNVSLDAARDLIIVELPGISNPERARKFLETTAKLEFWNVYRINDRMNGSGAGVLQLLAQADNKLSRSLAGDTSKLEDVKEVLSIKADSSWTYAYDGAGNINDSTLAVRYDTTFVGDDSFGNEGPLLKMLTLNNSSAAGLAMPITVVGTAEKNKIKQINKLLADPTVTGLLPKDLAFKWSHKPAAGYGEVVEGAKDLYELYAIKKEKGTDDPPLAGDVVTKASAAPDPTSGQIAVSLQMSGAGAKTWGQLTTKAANDNNREFAIVLDDRVVSAPSVRQPILQGSSSITGNFTQTEAEDLSKILQIGKLPAKISILQESLVGPSLGAENISRSITSLLIGFGLVFLFMIFYYGTGGIVSIIALLLNIFFIFGMLASFGTVLTLPGIAGIVLTIGMAVDANVIIYERIREELRAGKSLLMSIKDGFQHSYSAIIDANVTTVATAMILAYFGMGPIKGFAIVLIIGVFCSLFTAVLVGRMIIDWWTVDKGNNMTFWTGASQNAFANMSIDWLSKRKIAYVISGLIIALGIGSMATKGFDLGVDFKGGYSYNIQFDQDQQVSADGLRDALTTSFGSAPVVKEVSTDNTFNVVTSYNIDDINEGAADKVMMKLHEGVNAAVGGGIALNDFKDPATKKGARVNQSSKVGPTIADDIKTSSLYATIFALLFIFLYIFLRFSKWQYSAGAVAALFHDTLIVLSIFSIFWGILPFSLEVDQAFIAAILTVIGYSINDTVVVFDRIREYMNSYTGKTKEEVINLAVNSTVSRTVITSLTTLFVVAILLFFGGTSIRGFAFALFVGIIVGTYSSIFIATTIMSDLTGDITMKAAKTKSSFSKAAAK